MGPNLYDYWPFIPHWLPIKSYGFCVGLGFLVAAALARRRAGKVGVSGDDVLDLALCAIVSGVLGGRLFYVIQFHEQFAGRPLWSYFALHQGGLVFYGGFVAAVPACAWFIHRRKLPVLRCLDVAASVAMLGLAFGRIGCFSYGCCWGGPTDAWWGVIFPHGAPPYASSSLEWGTPLIPVQLVSSLNAFMLFVILSVYFHRFRKRDGEVTALLLILYPINRFCMEFLRGDTAVPGSLSVSQWISVLLVVGGVSLFVWVAKSPPVALAPPPKAPADAPPDRPRHTSKSKKRRRSGPKRCVWKTPSCTKESTICKPRSPP